MANEIPSSESFTGLSRKVIAYSERFKALVERIKSGKFSDSDWAPMEELVDTENFNRQGVFTSANTENFGWETYKAFVSEYGGSTDWEGTLRFIHEKDSQVVLGLEERNTRNGVTDVANTVTVYDFNDEGLLQHLEVYVMSLS